MIDKANEQIVAMLNKPYAEQQGQNKKYICWNFCREIYSLFGMKLEYFFHQRQLKRIAMPQLPCVVLFHAGADWHSGVVWPDTLHFIHACTKNVFEMDSIEYVVRKERLTIWPYNLLIEGYYAV